MTNGFSTFELMLIQRLESLELLSKEQRAAYESLHIDCVKTKTIGNTRMTIAVGLFGLLITVANILITLLL